jgi:hypothetical protein
MHNDEFRYTAPEIETKILTKTVNAFQSHWIDYAILVGICLCLGVFDAFVLKRSEKLFDSDYWIHSATRLCAYVLSMILGMRIRYPQAKSEHKKLNSFLRQNEVLLASKENDFSDFINVINTNVKIEQWKDKIVSKLAKLERKYPIYAVQYAHTKDEQYLYEKGKTSKRKKHIAEKYIRKKQECEFLLTDEYINKNVLILNVKSYRIYEHDFYSAYAKTNAVQRYKTRPQMRKNTAMSVSNVLLFSAIITILIGSVTLSFNESFGEELATTIVSTIVNTLIDIGLVLWKFSSGLTASERIVEQEDLVVAVNQNKILKDYYAEKNIKLTLPPIVEQEKSSV